MAVVLAATSALIACAHAPGRLEVASVHSEKLGKDMGFAVLRAPAEDGVDPTTLPVMVFLHGMGSDHRVFDRFEVSEAIYTAMEKGEIPKVHMVFPNGERGFYLNWYDGSHPYEDYILEEVIPRAEAKLGVRPTREGRHIAGVSMGGVGALQIGLRHPELFSSVSCLSGIVLDREAAREMMDNFLLNVLLPIENIWGDGTDEAFSDSINAFKLLPGEPGRPPQKIFLAYGTREKKKIVNSIRAYHAHLDAHKIVHKLVVFEGRHTWRDWIPVIEEDLKYIVRD